MGPDDTGADHLFIVRLRLERSQAGASEWRGSIEHVPTRARSYFVGIGGMDAFIASSVAADAELRPGS